MVEPHKRLGLRRRAVPTMIALWVATTVLANPAPTTLPPGEGQAVATRICGQCHSVELVMRHRLTRRQWMAQIDTMISKGAKVDDDDFEVLADYFARALAPESHDD